MRARQARLLATPQGETIRALRTRMLVEAANNCLPPMSLHTLFAPLHSNTRLGFATVHRRRGHARRNVSTYEHLNLT
ncbi:TPA: hypothetical protein N0F65_005233 [Lagenidium giganteum]|uniref:Uncharacterized protein n=1 Tax=Lagenidium giganteum TaxID=4803 RepID=A0AAV2YQ12_9STRA|nr:TPA: hypothetical protein N0F65_005233 [Lagenidium giganteum]